MKDWEITEKGTLLLTESESNFKLEIYLAINQKVQIFKALEKAMFNPVLTDKEKIFPKQ